MDSELFVLVDGFCARIIGSGVCELQVAVLNIRFTMNSIILLIVLLTLFLLRPPPSCVASTLVNLRARYALSYANVLLSLPLCSSL